MKNTQWLIVTSGLSGLIFGLGLMLSGMVDPSKVLAFLDITGAWDPSLALVMIGAITMAVFGYTLIKKRRLSLLAQAIQLPNKQALDLPLILGSLGFGIGWGLAGICPGPALVLLGTANVKGLVFVVFMLLGMGVFEWCQKPKKLEIIKHH